MNDAPAWRELSPAEVEAKRLVMVNCEALSEASICQVDRQARTLFVNSVAAFVRRFGRPPSEHEAEVLARIVAEHLNSFVVPRMAERDAATIQ